MFAKGRHCLTIRRGIWDEPVRSLTMLSEQKPSKIAIRRRPGPVDCRFAVASKKTGSKGADKRVCRKRKWN